MRAKLSTSKTINSLKANIFMDNRVLGLKGAEVLAALFGGHTEQLNKNTQALYVNNGIKFAVGVGKFPKCFVKSANKGSGREGSTLKSGDYFIHLEFNEETQQLNTTEYTRVEVLEALAKK